MRMINRMLRVIAGAIDILILTPVIIWLYDMEAEQYE